MKLVGANASAKAVGLGALPGRSNYFIGNDPKKWRTDVPTYAKVKYEGVYPGVDLVYYGNQGGQLEYDFVVAPGADPKAITLDVGLPQPVPLRLDANGDLVTRGVGGDLRFHKPVVYQQDGEGRRHYIDGHYSLQAMDPEIKNPNSRTSFEVDSYDRTKPLVIDPVLSYSTYLAGSSGSGDVPLGIAVDSSGSSYVTGYTNSTDFPTSSPIQSGNAGNYDAFVAKLNPAGSALVYSTYLGGSNFDLGSAIAVDSSGNAYVTGETYSTNFPTANALQAGFGGGSYDAFVAKLNAAGSALVYSTYLGGSSADVGTGIAVDSSGNAYVTGQVFSTDFPTTPGAFQTALAGTASDAFVAKIAAKSSSSTTVGSSANPSILNQSVTFTANVSAVPPATGAPTGTVTFKDGSTTIGTGTLNPSGQATIAISSLAVNSHSVTAIYAGDANFNGSTSATLIQQVQYGPGGRMCFGDAGHQILQPINADGTSVWKQGRTIPAQFRVCDFNGNSIGTAGVVSSFYLTEIISGTVTNVDESVSSTTPDTAFRWDATNQQWIFNISTTSLVANNTYVYTITLNDGTTIGFQYGLK